MATRTAYQLKLSLNDMNPPIWRRLLVDPRATLSHLHRVIQVTMDWMGYHLHEFQLGDVIYGPQCLNGGGFGPPARSELTRISTILTRESPRMRYEYDFGDGWEVLIRLERELEVNRNTRLPKCMGGARHGPLEDSGGPNGYQELVTTLKEPNNRDYKDVREWAPVGFDPDDFEIKDVNSKLRDEFPLRKRV
ncbi:MAG TPA: plasmid pRiA4b ORF-3 family protein [Spirochaetia bacterium]|nr:plasmid pRiA4b ORF-3 family protein [Spirochaetia bacterium]